MFKETKPVVTIVGQEPLGPSVRLNSEAFRTAVVRGNSGFVDDPWAVDIGRADRGQPADARVTDRDLLGSKLGCRRSATHLRAAVLYLTDV